MVAQEFQAVIFAGGRGTRFPEIGERPKCLVPVGPYPLIWYPLNMLQKHKFQDVIVIVIEQHKSEIQQKLERTPLKIKIDYVSIAKDFEFGTADSLRSISEKIKTDVLLVSCDVITDASLFPLINHFREREAAVAALYFQGGMENDAFVPGLKMNYKPEKDLIATNPTSNRLLFMASTSDFEENILLPGHLLRSNGKVNIHSGLVDAHIYVVKKWVIDFNAGNKFTSIKGELLPHIVKKQMSCPVEKSEIDKIYSESNVKNGDNGIFDFVAHTDIDLKINEASIFHESCSEGKNKTDLMRCYAVMVPRTSFGLRINTLQGYCAINKKIFSKLESLSGSKTVPLISPNATIKSTQINDCSVAENTVVSEKTSLTSSILGSNCIVNPKVRIANSVLMTSVIIEEGVILDNCIVCDKAKVKSGSVLKNCLVGPNYVVEENTIKEKVYLSNADSFMEIE